jgi:hypothetical protein
MADEVPAFALKSVRDVLAYFLRHPAAADSLEGIARWRVQQEVVPHIVEQVDRALAWLVDHHLLVREDRAGVASTFRLNPTHAAEAERLLRDIESHDAAAEEPRVGDVLEPAGSLREPPLDTRPSALMDAALAWIDAVLLRYHRRHLASGDDLPGLTRSHASVDTALTPRVIPAAIPPETQDDVDLKWRELEAALAGAPDDETFAALYRRLELTHLELQAVLLSLAPEVDAKYQSVYGVLNDDLGRRTTTLGLVCAVLGDPAAVRWELAQSGGLTRWQLLEHGAALPYADQPLRLDAAVVAWLLGDARALLHDPRLAAAIDVDDWRGAGWIGTGGQSALVRDLTEAFATPGDDGWIVISGGDLDASRAALEAAALDARRTLTRIVLPRVARPDAAELRNIAALAARAVRLFDAIVAVDVDVDAFSTPGERTASVRALIDAVSSTSAIGVLIVSDVQTVVSVLPHGKVRVLRQQAPDSAAATAILAAAAAAGGLRISDRDAERLAMAFPLQISAIDDAVRLAVLEDAAELEPAGQAASLATALRRIASPDLPRFARSVDPPFDLGNVVLPPDRLRQLHEMVAHVRYAYRVLYTWGFSAQLSYGRGITALFCGPSGTGKTMAAQAIARELGTRAYIVDLSRVVSKYIGQTEQNLDAVFHDAERAGAVLLFDEADALFGKRSEIKDSHDRYANIEVAYLLQRMEAFTGLAILTTNFRRNLDEAFMRRLRFVVEFPKPDAPAREAIWRFCLPDTAPLAGDLNLRLLARRLDLTGGSIRQITVRAAFAAAADGSSAIAMRHVIAAARAELLKLGMTGSERDLTEVEAATLPSASRVA